MVSSTTPVIHPHSCSWQCSYVLQNLYRRERNWRQMWGVTEHCPQPTSAQKTWQWRLLPAEGFLTQLQHGSWNVSEEYHMQV